MGYERNYLVERRGEFAIRGGIFDVFPPSSERPVRAEFWGDEITSLRHFALATQRSLDDIERVEIAPCRELRADARDARARRGTGGGERRLRPSRNLLRASSLRGPSDSCRFSSMVSSR